MSGLKRSIVLLVFLLLSVPETVFALRRAGPGTYIDVNVYSVPERASLGSAAPCAGEPMHKKIGGFYGIHDPSTQRAYLDTDFSSHGYPASFRVYIDSVDDSGNACIGIHWGSCIDKTRPCALSSSTNAQFTNNTDEFLYISTMFHTRTWTKLHLSSRQQVCRGLVDIYGQNLPADPQTNYMSSCINNPSVFAQLLATRQQEACEASCGILNSCYPNLRNPETESTQPLGCQVATPYWQLPHLYNANNPAGSRCAATDPEGNARDEIYFRGLWQGIVPDWNCAISTDFDYTTNTLGKGQSSETSQGNFPDAYRWQMRESADGSVDVTKGYCVYEDGIAAGESPSTEPHRMADLKSSADMNEIRDTLRQVECTLEYDPNSETGFHPDRGVIRNKA